MRELATSMIKSIDQDASDNNDNDGNRNDNNDMINDKNDSAQN